MIEEQFLTAVEPYPKKAIATATVVALLVAAVLLITAVLPAEYGIDPLGTGKALHLTDLSKATSAAVAPKPSETAAASKSGETPATIVPVLEPSVDGSAPKLKGAFIPQSKGYKIDSREIT